MKKKRFTEARIAFVLRQAKGGGSVEQIVRELGISEAAFYRWKKRYSGLGVSELRHLKQLYDGRRLRLLTIVDNHTRESLAIKAGQRIRGLDVAELLEQLVSEHGCPEAIQVDNGPEFISKELDIWAYSNQVKLDFSRPGKPTDNAYIESFNARFRQECLNEYWSLSLSDAQEKIDVWRRDYNYHRPHSSLENLAPAVFAGQNPPGLRSENFPPLPQICPTAQMILAFDQD